MNKQISLFVAAVFAIMFIASASATLYFTNPTYSDAVHGTTISGVIQLYNFNASNYSAITLHSPDSEMRFDQPSSYVLTNSTSPLNVTYYVDIPLYTVAGDNVYTFYINATENNATGSYPVSGEGTVTVDVNGTKSLSVGSISDIIKSTNKTSFTVTNTGNVALNDIILAVTPRNFTDQASNNINLTLSSYALASLRVGESQTVNITANIPDSMALGHYLATVNASVSGGISAAAGVRIRSDFCELGEKGNAVKITKVESTLDWTTEWRQLEENTVEVSVKNAGSEEQDITVKLALYDPVDEAEIDLENDEQTVTVDNGDTETAAFTFKIPGELDKSSYRLYVKAYIDGDEEGNCTDTYGSSLYQDIKIKKSTHEVIVSNFDFPDFAMCGDTANLFAEAFNTGNSDEGKVKVRIRSTELGLDMESEIFNNLDKGESEKVAFSFIVPQNIAEKNYTIKFTSYYNYDDNDDDFGKQADYTSTLAVLGNTCKAPAPVRTATINASLVSGEVKAGKELAVKIDVTNTGNETATFNLALEGHESWASLNKIEPAALTIASGATQSATVYFNLNKDSAGEQSFTIRAVSGSQVIPQQVRVTVEKSSFIPAWLSNNWVALAIAGNILLILVIVIVAIKISRSKD